MRRACTIVVAASDAGVIGKNNDLVWDIPEDRKYFRTVTMGHAILMGRKTYDSVGKPLPGRRNIVISRSENLVIAGCEVVPSLAAALDLAWKSDEDPCVIGGAQIYAEALTSFATRILLTEVHMDAVGDAFFHVDRSEWREVDRKKGTTAPIDFVTLVRANPNL